MTELDPLIHAPARLQAMTTLSAVSEAEFATLRTALEVSDSVLSKHLSALADAGYVHIRKGVLAGRRTTWIALTNSGRRALREHVAALRRLIDMVADFETRTSPSILGGFPHRCRSPLQVPSAFALVHGLTKQSGMRHPHQLRAQVTLAWTGSAPWTNSCAWRLGRR
jgi:DNA-binding MarR family transcriptional regulator